MTCSQSCALSVLAEEWISAPPPSLQLFRGFGMRTPSCDHVMTSFQSPAAGTVANLPCEPENQPPFLTKAARGQRVVQTKNPQKDTLTFLVHQNHVCCPAGKKKRKEKKSRSDALERLNENQLAKLHPVPCTKGVTERAPGDPQATLKHLEHLCSSKFFFYICPLIFGPWNEFCLPGLFSWTAFKNTWGFCGCSIKFPNAVYYSLKQDMRKELRWRQVVLTLSKPFEEESSVNQSISVYSETRLTLKWLTWGKNWKTTETKQEKKLWVNYMEREECQIRRNN